EFRRVLFRSSAARHRQCLQSARGRERARGRGRRLSRQALRTCRTRPHREAVGRAGAARWPTAGRPRCGSARAGSRRRRRIPAGCRSRGRLTADPRGGGDPPQSLSLARPPGCPPRPSVPLSTSRDHRKPVRLPPPLLAYAGPVTPVELSRTVLRAVRCAVEEGELDVAVPERVVVAPPGGGGCGDYATGVALQ